MNYLNKVVSLQIETLMNIIFEHSYLEELYTEGKTKNKKYQFQKSVITQYIKTINKLVPASRIEDLFNIKSLNYKKLTNRDFESVRVNDQYRIEFKTSIIGEEPDLITICSISKLSNHYK